MSNVPWHEEVTGFVKQFADKIPDYEIACEHEHSNCLLLAHKRVSVHVNKHSELKIADILKYGMSPHFRIGRHAHFTMVVSPSVCPSQNHVCSVT